VLDIVHAFTERCFYATNESVSVPVLPWALDKDLADGCEPVMLLNVGMEALSLTTPHFKCRKHATFTSPMHACVQCMA
jgi:hypothetical protein